MFCYPYTLMPYVMIFLTNKLDTENLNDKNYKWPFYFTLRDSEHVNLGNRVDDTIHQQK